MCGGQANRSPLTSVKMSWQLEAISLVSEAEASSPACASALGGTRDDDDDDDDDGDRGRCFSGPDCTRERFFPEALDSAIFFSRARV